MQVNGNMYLNTAKPFAKETDPFHEPAFNPEIRLIEENEAVYLEMSLPNAPQGRLVTSEQLGKTRASAARFETPEGRPFLIDTDYFGTPRGKHSAAGPVSNPGTGSIKLKVWPKN